MEIIGSLLQFAIKHAEGLEPEDPSHDECWEAVESARKYLAAPVDHQATMRDLMTSGCSFSDCTRIWGVDEANPYVQAARKAVAGSDDVNVDAPTVLSQSDDGAWVMAWLWISNEEAGILQNSDLLEEVLNHARNMLDHQNTLDEETLGLRNDQADWLEDLISNYADEIDDIEHEMSNGTPGPINWINVQCATVRFMPSDALNQLRLLAKIDGLPDNLADQAEKFCIRYGNKLDAMLTVIGVDHVPEIR